MQGIFHFHLPKTGGMALHAFLVDQLGKEGVSPPLGAGDFNENLLRWSGKAAISGHFSVRQGDSLPKSRICLTVLRNPVDRLISEFYYNRHDVDGLFLSARRFVVSLDEYLEELTQGYNEKALTQISMLYPFGTASQSNLTLEQKLGSAVRALEQFDLVGIQEELEDFSRMLSASMSWPVLPLHHKNKSSKIGSSRILSNGQVKKLESLLEPEIELYNQAVKIFRANRREFISSSGSVTKTINVSATLPVIESDSNCPITSGNSAQSPKNFGNLKCEIMAVTAGGNLSGFNKAMAGELMEVTIQFVAHQSVDQLNVGFSISDERGSLMYGTNSLLLNKLFSVDAGKYVAIFTFLNRLGPGFYSIDAALIRTKSHYDDCYHWLERVTQFQVDAYASQHYEGRVLLDVNVNFGGQCSDAKWSAARPSQEIHEARAFGRLNLPLNEYASLIEPMTQFDILPSGVDTLLQVKITNLGNQPWPSSGRQPVNLSYKWIRDNGIIVVEDGLRTQLNGDIESGQSAVLPLLVRTPTENGNFLLLISLVQEQVAWFFDQNADSCCQLAVIVR